MRNGLVINANGDKFWYKNDLLHRVDGPAIEHADGEKWWYQNDKLHRLDGPAIIYYNGDKHWFYEGIPMCCSSQQEFEKKLKLKAFW